MATEFKVKDSGKRQQFNSGAVRDIQDGKGRFDLISPVALRYLAKHYESGSAKYGDDNWLKGIPLKRIMDSAIRHLNNYLEGDRSENHLIACAWNCFAAFHTMQMVENGTMSPELMNLNCFVAENDMDEETKKWWDKINKIKKTKVNKVAENDMDEETKKWWDKINKIKKTKVNKSDDTQ